MHVKVSNLPSGSVFQATIDELGGSDHPITSSEYGHLHLLLKEGHYTVTVSVPPPSSSGQPLLAPRTKVVRVHRGEFTDVVYALPPQQPAVPR